MDNIIFYTSIFFECLERRNYVFKLSEFNPFVCIVILLCLNSVFLCSLFLFSFFPASPLHICAPKGMLEVTDTLLSKGCSVVAVDSRGFTPILACAPNEDVATCIAMIMQIYFSNPANTESARKSICSIGKHD